MAVRRVLVIAGSDPSGGAGISRDVATLASISVEAAPVITAITAQTHERFAGFEAVRPEMVRAQIDAALVSGGIGAVKIGMLATAEIVLQVSQALEHRENLPVILDPVLASSSGGTLLDEEGQQVLRERLLPRVFLLTPNLGETALLTGMHAAPPAAGAKAQAERLHALGCRRVLVKDGHGSGEQSSDVLYVEGEQSVAFSAPRRSGSARGTGCTLSSVIAGQLARGMALEDAIRAARAQVLARLRAVAP